jgi:cytochrome P450
MDETYWTDPEVFRPERHIDKFGQIIKTDRLFPFGGGTLYFRLHGVHVLSVCSIAGKRSCLGESLARTSYFLFTTSILKTFIFRSLPGSVSAPTLSPLDGFTLGHRPFHAFLTKR